MSICHTTGCLIITLIGPREMQQWFWICKFQTYLADWYHEYSLWNCFQVISKKSHYWQLNIGSANGLVPSGNKPLLEPMLTETCQHLASPGLNELMLREGKGKNSTKDTQCSGCCEYFSETLQRHDMIYTSSFRVIMMWIMNMEISTIDKVTILSVIKTFYSSTNIYYW